MAEGTGRSNGENPNGIWKLYVADAFPTNPGDVEGGWSLALSTGPVDTRVPGSGATGAASNVTQELVDRDALVPRTVWRVPRS